MVKMGDVLDAIAGVGKFAPPMQGDGSRKMAHSFGNITTIANRLGLARFTIYKYIERWPKVKQAIADQRELKNDFVEDLMFKRMVEGSDTMMIFHAKTQMKHRGYVEKTEIEHSGTVINMNWGDIAQTDRDNPAETS